MLESEGLPLGVVTAIAGQSRFNLVFHGHAGHAGTTPMDLRRDAAAAAAEFVLAAERVARAEPGLVATVGELNVPRGAVNVIPGRADVTLDVRHQDDAVREAALARAARRDGGDRRAPRRARQLVDDLRAARHAAAPLRWSPASPRRCEQTGIAVRELPSGAGHDAVTMAGVTDVAMLFVRCAGGISHHPDESVTEADVALAIEAAVRFVRNLKASKGSGPLGSFMFDLVVRGGTVVAPSGVIDADVGVLDGAIAAIAPELEGAGA